MNTDPHGWQDATALALVRELDSAAGLQTFPLDPASDLASRLERLVPTLLQAAHEVWSAEALDGLLDGRVILDSALSGRIVAAAVVMSTKTLVALEIDYTLTDRRDGFDRLDIRLGQVSPEEPLGIRQHGLSQAVNLLHDLGQPRAAIAWAYTSRWTRRPVSGADRRKREVASGTGLTPKVIEILSVIVASSGRAERSHLAVTCALTKPQLARQLNWMEKQDLINQVDAGNGRVHVRATRRGRAALTHSADNTGPTT